MSWFVTRTKLLVLVHIFVALPLLRAAPLTNRPIAAMEDPPMSPTAPTLWIYIAVAMGLVLLGGAFAGLTIALMGQVRRLELHHNR